jgi:hypothetical protein
MHTQPDDNYQVQLFCDMDGNSYHHEEHQHMKCPASHQLESNQAEHMYLDNGDGSLFSVGVAGL